MTHCPICGKSDLAEIHTCTPVQRPEGFGHQTQTATGWNLACDAWEPYANALEARVEQLEAQLAGARAGLNVWPMKQRAERAEATIARIKAMPIVGYGHEPENGVYQLSRPERVHWKPLIERPEGL